MKFVWSFLIATFIFGCAQFSDDKGWPVTSDRILAYNVESNDTTKVVIKRFTDTDSSSCTTDLYINDELVIEKLRQAENVTFYLPEGRYKIGARLCKRIWKSRNILIFDKTPREYAIHYDSKDKLQIMDMNKSK